MADSEPAVGAWGSGGPLPVAPLSVAPMMEVTDRHFRVFMRIITRRTTLYTEMVTDQVCPPSCVRRFSPGASQPPPFRCPFRPALPPPPL